jgi:hypothetical protein
MKRAIIITAFVMTFIAPPAFGQAAHFVYVQPYNTLPHVIASTTGFEQMINDERKCEEFRNNDYEYEDDEEDALRTATLTYIPSPARRNSNLAKLKSVYLKQNNNAEVKAMFDELFTTNMYSAVDAKFEKASMSSANFADVMAAHIVTNWQAAHSVSDANVPEIATLALATKMDEMLGTDKNMRALSDPEKQLAAEELIAQTLIAAALNEQGQANPQIKQAAQNFGRAALKQLGFDYTKFKITSEGLGPV